MDEEFSSQVWLPAYPNHSSTTAPNELQNHDKSTMDVKCALSDNEDISMVSLIGFKNAKSC
jgi:hypothetical protein